MKKGIALGLSAVLLCSLFSGCGNGTVKQTNQSLSLTVDGITKEQHAELFQRYEKTYPDVELTINTYGGMDFQSFRSKMNAQLMAGEGDDVILIGFNYFDDIYKLMQGGVFAPLEELMEADSEFKREDYQESMLADGVFEGHQYVIPLGMKLPFYVTTKEIAEEVGLEAEQCTDYMKTAEQFDKLAQKYPERMLLPSAGQLGNFPNVMGVPLFDYEKKEVLVDTPEMKQAFAHYKNVYEQDNRNVFVNEIAVVVEELLTKSCSLFLASGTRDLFETAAELNKAGQTPILLPQYGMDGSIGGLCEFGMTVRANSENQQNAYNLIKLFMSEEGQFAGNQHYVPLRKSAQEQLIEKAVLRAGDVPQDFVEAYRTALNDMTRCDFITLTVIEEFVHGKMQPYLDGTASYEDCMKDFVDFAEIYLSE